MGPLSTSTAAVPERWLSGVRHGGPAIPLLCFPFAGGGASAFVPWRGASATFAVLPLQYPARETRWTDPQFESFDALVDAIATDLAPLWSGTFAFWGHSFGAYVAFELTRRLRVRGGVLPCHLFLSGAQAPHLPARDPIHHLAPGAFLRKLVAFNGIPRELLENRELLAMLLPVIQHDFRLLEQYEYRQEEPLPVPLSVFGGLQDEHVEAGDLLAWSIHTSSTFRPRFVEGDHFFPFASPETMSAYLSEDLVGSVAGGVF